MNFSELSRRIADECWIRLVLSNPVEKEGIKKIEVERMTNGRYAIRALTKTQAFQDSRAEEDLLSYLTEQGLSFRQWNGRTATEEFQIKCTKKGDWVLRAVPTAAPVREKEPGNRKKKYLLEEGRNVPALVDMGIFTAEGKVVRSMYDKFRQINRFLELIDDEIGKFEGKTLRIIDFGCGKSYLTFILYHYLTEIRGIEAHITGLDLKEDVIRKCNDAAERYGYQNLRFETGSIEGYRPSEGVDMVITLHACDTATDYALFHAAEWGAKYIFSVPCCQHELNAQIHTEGFSVLTRYGIAKERISALFTDVIRANLLEAAGYRVQLLEFVDLSHTPKNLLIRAVRAEIPKKIRETMRREVAALTQEFHLDPTLLRLFSESDLK